MRVLLPKFGQWWCVWDAAVKTAASEGSPYSLGPFACGQTTWTRVISVRSPEEKESHARLPKSF